MMGFFINKYIVYFGMVFEVNKLCYLFLVRLFCMVRIWILVFIRCLRGFNVCVLFLCLVFDFRIIKVDG